MKVFGTVQAVLERKNRDVWTVSPDTTVYDAIRVMADRNVGALPVVDGGRLVGILSERDYTRKVILKGKTSKDTPVCEIMFSPVTTVEPSTTVEDCLRLMTEKRIRHLPVQEGDRMVGLVSIGDLVNWTISAQQETISHLANYISGTYPG